MCSCWCARKETQIHTQVWHKLGMTVSSSSMTQELKLLLSQLSPQLVQQHTPTKPHSPRQAATIPPDK